MWPRLGRAQRPSRGAGKKAAQWLLNESLLRRHDLPRRYDRLPATARRCGPYYGRDRLSFYPRRLESRREDRGFGLPRLRERTDAGRQCEAIAEAIAGSEEWSVGVLEYWALNATLHYSTTPVLQALVSLICPRGLPSNSRRN